MLSLYRLRALMIRIIHPDSNLTTYTFIQPHALPDRIIINQYTLNHDPLQDATITYSARNYYHSLLLENQSTLDDQTHCP